MKPNIIPLCVQTWEQMRNDIHVASLDERNALEADALRQTPEQQFQSVSVYLKPISPIALRESSRAAVLVPIFEELVSASVLVVSHLLINRAATPLSERFQVG